MLPATTVMWVRPELIAFIDNSFESGFIFIISIISTALLTSQHKPEGN